MCSRSANASNFLLLVTRCGSPTSIVLRFRNTDWNEKGGSGKMLRYTCAELIQPSRLTPHCCVPDTGGGPHHFADLLILKRLSPSDLLPANFRVRPNFLNPRQSTRRTTTPLKSRRLPRVEPRYTYGLCHILSVWSSMITMSSISADSKHL